MPRRLRTIVALLVAAVAVAGAYTLRHDLPGIVADLLGTDRPLAAIRDAREPELSAALAEKGLSFGSPVYIRIFKEEAVLELFVRQDNRFRLFRTYPICNFSGDLGPKLREGDRQSPEGFYAVTRAALNPNSRFHLSFNLGFPNAFDRAQGRTGSFLMVHGRCVSVGCYAMTDPAIEEIYLLVEAALNGGQPSVSVHAFPFRMTDARLTRTVGQPWHSFWRDLKPAFDSFNASRIPPRITVDAGRYVIADPA